MIQVKCYVKLFCALYLRDMRTDDSRRVYIYSSVLIKFRRFWNSPNPNQVKTVLIVKQILLTITMENISRAVWRICMLLIGG